MMSEEEKVFKDPVHGYIYVHDAVIWDLINTREMQRLRRIRQLGTTYVAYPGGDHSRFSHSLGVYEVIRQILMAFERNGYDWPRNHRLLAMVSGLLHDIGHGPFSHALEEVFGSRHEMWSEAIILDPATEVHAALESVYRGFARDVADVIAGQHENRLVVSLVSGQLDADRLDYLMRDSIATGVDYGKFDLARIIRVMLPHEGRIVVKRSGIHTVEAYLLARYFMYWQVYFHPVSRSAEVLLRAILRRAEELFHNGLSLTLPHSALSALFDGTMKLEQYLALDDAVLFNAFNVWQSESDAILSDLCRRFLNRRLFKYMEYPSANDEVHHEILRWVQNFGYEPRYYALVDAPGTVYYDYYLGRQNKDGAVLLWDRDLRSLTEMSSESSPIRAIAEETARVRRLYVPEEVLLDPQTGKRLGDLVKGPVDKGRG